jgi:NADPH:quinone reductase
VHHDGDPLPLPALEHPQDRVARQGADQHVGRGVGVEVRARVSSLAEEAFADQALVDAGWLAPVADGVDDGMASMLGMGGPVALGALRLGRLAAGETVLVHAAAGGIGHLAVKLAKLHGAGTVIATASSRAKLDLARSLGADVAVDYTDPEWPQRVRRPCRAAWTSSSTPWPGRCWSATSTCSHRWAGW